MKLLTSLISGAGNTFHVAWKNPTTIKEQQQQIARQMCLKYPADGFIFLNSDDASNFYWNFYNNDGSVAEMCGNATRCVGYFIKNNLNNSLPLIHLKTMAGLIAIESLSPDSYRIQMTEIIHIPHPNYFYCDTGVPHIVIDFADFKNYKNHLDYCKNLRFHSDFLPKGTNVTLISKTSDPKILKAVSYERGVENFTQACGTGAMAAAYYNYMKYNQQVTTIQMPGGDLLLNLENIKKPLMTGPATLLGDCEYDIEI